MTTMAIGVKYPVICRNGHDLGLHELGEYPYSWQFMVCPICNYAATPDLTKPHEIVVNMGEPEY